jgi:hypothetical protein
VEEVDEGTMNVKLHIYGSDLSGHISGILHPVVLGLIVMRATKCFTANNFDEVNYAALATLKLGRPKCWATREAMLAYLSESIPTTDMLVTAGYGLLTSY